MAKSKPIQTPYGTFASAAQAARAHHCDRSTILNRVQTDPENYRVVDAVSRQPVVRVATQAGWTHYRSLSNDDRDAWYVLWCRESGLDPESEEGGNAFFDALDAAGDEHVVQD